MTSTTRFAWRALFVALCIATVFALLTVGCTTDTETTGDPGVVTITHHRIAEPPILAETAGDPPQLVTVPYLVEQAARKIAPIWTQAWCQVFYGPGSPMTCRPVGVTADHWTSDKTVHVDWVATHRTVKGVQFHFTFSYVFSDQTFDTSHGDVTVGKCTTRPGAGVASTGELSDIDNQTDNPIEHTISKSVEEVDSQSTTLAESVEINSTTTIEGGTPLGGSVGQEFSETFGINHEDTHDHSTTTSNSVEAKIEVEPRHEVLVGFTTDNKTVDCDVDLNSPADWKIALHIDGCPHEQGCHSVWRLDRQSTHNPHMFWHSDLHDDHTVTFDSSDDMWRALKGTDTRCFDCHFEFDKTAAAALDKMADPDTRNISFKGKQTSHTKADASYKAIDVTDRDDDCVRSALSTNGKSIDSVEQCS